LYGYDRDEEPVTELTAKGEQQLRVSCSNQLAQTTREPDPEPPDLSTTGAVWWTSDLVIGH